MNGSKSNKETLHPRNLLVWPTSPRRISFYHAVIKVVQHIIQTSSNSALNSISEFCDTQTALFASVNFHCASIKLQIFLFYSWTKYVLFVSPENGINLYRQSQLFARNRQDALQCALCERIVLPQRWNAPAVYQPWLIIWVPTRRSY